jgi:hypothetical protein
MSQYQREIERSIVQLQTSLDFLNKAREYVSVNNMSMAAVMMQRASGVLRKAEQEIPM